MTWPALLVASALLWLVVTAAVASGVHLFQRDHPAWNQQSADYKAAADRQGVRLGCRVGLVAVAVYVVFHWPK